MVKQYVTFFTTQLSKKQQNGKRKSKLLSSLLILLVLMGWNFCWGQTLYESFSYTTPLNIGGSTNTTGGPVNNWFTHSNSQVGVIAVTSGSLTYAGLQSSAGDKIRLPGANSTVPRDVNRATTGTGATAAYYSFLLNVATNTQLGVSHGDNGYFIAFGGTSGTSVSTLFGRVSIRSVNSGANYRLGISNTTGGTPTYTDVVSDLNFAQTYLIVVKYDFNGASNDIATIWVDPTSLGGTEPSGGITNNSGTSTAPNAFASMVLRNASATPNADIDEIRVGTTWASVTPSGISISSSGTPASLSTIYGTASTTTSFSVSATNLSASTGITITPPVGFEVAISSDFSTTIGTNASPLNVGGAGTVNSTTVFLRLAANATVGNKTGNIVLSSTGATSVNVATNTTNTVNPKGLTISGLSVQDKNFDNSTSATLVGIPVLVGIESVGTAVTLGGTPVANFDTPAVGNNKPVTVTGYTISGADATNYTLTQPSLTGNILSTGLLDQIITFGPLSSVNYGVASFSLTATSDSGLPVSYSSSDTNIATISGSTINIVGAGTVTITATQVGNSSYNPASPVQQSLFVNPKELTISGATASNKVYDADTTTTISGGTLVGIINSDDVSFSGTGNFDDFNVGTAKTVTGNLTLSGAKAGNYFLTQPILSADITPKELTITGISISNKEYDTTDSATILGSASLFGVEFADAFSVSLGGTPVATFNNAAVGNNKPVTVLGYTFSGSSNYFLTQPTGLTANITLRTITIVGLTANNKEYDRTLGATLSGTASLSGILPGDELNVSLAGTPSANFLTATAGDGKTVAVTGYSLSGTALANYTLGALNLTANITKKEVTISGASVADKPYDGSTSASLSGTLSGVISPDNVTLNLIASFSDANVGNAKPVTSTSTISGTDALNYNLTQPTGLTASITPIPCVAGNSGVVTWNFATAAPSSMTATGVTISNIIQGNNNGTTTLITSTSASTGYAGVSGTNNAGAAARIGALDTATNGSAYFEFTITPSISAITLSGLSFGSRSTGSGPQAFTLRSSADGYTANLATGTLTNNSVWVLRTPTVSNAPNSTSPVTYRLYGHGGSGTATAGTANWRIDDLQLTLTSTLNPALSSATTATTCSGNNFTYTPTTSYSGSTITWTRAAVSGINNSAITTPQSGSISEVLVNTTTSPVNVTYAFTVTTSTCFLTQNVVVTVNPLLSWYLDADVDGYYTGAMISSCDSPGAGYTTSIIGGGDCNDSNPAINPGVAEICYNGIDDNCSGVANESCPTPAVNMTATTTTLPTFSTAVAANPYSLAPYTNLKYRFIITKIQTGQANEVQELTLPTRFVTIPQAMRSYTATYTIRAAAVINDEILAYLGNTMTVTPPSIDPITLSPTSCGATLSNLNASISANPGLNATGYIFRIRRASGTSPLTGPFFTSSSPTRFISANTFSGLPLEYSSAYKVSVAYTYLDPSDNSTQTTAYGAECDLFTLTIPTINLVAPTCGTLLAPAPVSSMTATVAAAPASGATGYQFRIRQTGGSTYFTTGILPSRFTQLSLFGTTLAFSTNYSISVQYYSLINGVITPSGYGSECHITTPSFPTTRLVQTQCGNSYTLAQQLNIVAYPGFPKYKVKLSQPLGEDENIIAEREVDYSYFKMGDFPEAQVGETYFVSVSIRINGVFGPYDTTCEITVAPAARTVAVVPFKATAYPNPFAENFMLNVKTESASLVNVKVYDMVGRLIEQREVRTSDLETTTIGDNYPSGVYNIVVAQEGNLETVRVVKR